MSSASPTRYHGTPSPSAEIRSQAIAKLKRAASLPRNADGGRRPLVMPGGFGSGGLSSSTATSEEGHAGGRGGGAGSSASGHSHSSAGPTPSPSRLHYDYEEEERLLGGPEVNVTPMQRTLSESSSFHIPTPPHILYGSSNTSPFYTAQASPVNPGADWPVAAPMPRQHHYLPQGVNPISVPPSSFPSSLQTPGGPQRNTPSPLLPTLTDLRNLSRSNSAAARAKAMCKLTGQPETPTRSTNIPTPMSSDEDVRFGFHGLPGSRLTRSGTIGIPRMFGLSNANNSQPAVAMSMDDTAALIPAAPIPDTAFDVPRPRLQRSFTVSSSNMGEERRSAVGRRMVERLAERRAARQQEEGQVRKLWEESRRQAELRKSTDTWSKGQGNTGIVQDDDDDEEGTDEDEDGADEEDEGVLEHEDGDVDDVEHDDDDDGYRDSVMTTMTDEGDWQEGDDYEEDELDEEPTTARHPLVALPPAIHAHSLLSANHPDDRTPSRSTERSDEFEYESHLRRSLSGRTARNENLDTSPEVAMPSPLIEDASEEANNEGVFLRQQLLRAHSSASNGHSSHGHSNLGHSSHGHSNLGHSSHGHSNFGHDGHSLNGHSYQSSSSHGHHSTEDTVLPLPVLPFAAAARHATQESVSSSATIMPPPGHSPGVESSAGSAPARSPVLIPGFIGADLGQDNGNHHDKTSRSASQNSSRGEAPMTTAFNAYESSDGRGGHDTQDSINSLASVASTQERSISRMSWDDISHEDAMSSSKKGSLTGKKGRAMLNALRKHSASRDAIASPPASPRNPFAQAFRRDSETSLNTAGQRSARESPRGIKHEASSSSLSREGPAASANNFLIQHQLSNSPSPVSFLPRADIKDPRIMNSKLSPFPGISMSAVGAASRSRSGSESQGHEMPRVMAAEPHRPLNDTTHGPPRSSEDNSSGGSGRRNWLGKATPTSQTSRTSGAMSDNHSRQGSNSSGQYGSHGRKSNPSPIDDYRNGSMRTADSFNEATPRDGGKMRPEIPSFMVNRRRAPPPPIELGSSNVVSINDDAEKSSKKFDALPKRSVEVLNRMDKMLSLSANDPARPDFLDDPPRKLLLSQQVFQVVNTHTVKDRYLFLFNDILVVAKPVITQGVQATLDMKFVVKSVVSLDKLSVSGIGEDSTQEPPRHHTVASFIKQFSEDARKAVHRLVENSSLGVDSLTLATLLFKTPELDKSQLGSLLATDAMLLRAYVDHFHFGGVRIDDALRMFLLAIRLPTDISEAEMLLCGFADGFHEANQNHVPYDRVRARDLVLATMELNDMLYSTFGFAFPNHAVSADTFVSAFRSKDPNWLVPDDVLEDVYDSIRSSKLVQALAPHEAYLARDVTITPARLPAKLTLNEWSEPMTITLPRADPGLKLKLLGEGLEFDTPILDFGSNREASFHVRGTTLGTKSMLFERIGSSAAQYASIGNSRTFTVERTYMRHTFHVQFMSHLGQRRKYCFSIPDAAARQKWGAMLTRQVWLTTEKKTGAGAPTTPEQRVRRAAEAVSVQVLRDALLPQEKPVDNDATPHASRKPSTVARNNRMGSVSVAYAAQAAMAESLSHAARNGKGEKNGEAKGMVELQTGKELVLLCRQNSLLPTVLELLQSGTEPVYGTSSMASSFATLPHPMASPFGIPHSQSQQSIPHSAQMQATPGPLKSAGLKAKMQDRRL